MTLEAIRKNGYPQADRDAVEDAVISAVRADPGRFIAAYVADERSFDGRYVCADLFKETFHQYAESPEARNRYNGPVHNSAAVLSAEQFRRVLAEPHEPGRDTVYFLTGIPGAGKTSSILVAGRLPQDAVMVFEGQLSNPETTRAKLAQVLDAGYQAHIIAVHARPENALENTFRRFSEIGRGASINVMSSIQGNLPASLREVRNSSLGNSIDITIFDYRDRAKPSTLRGWNHLAVLESEGNHEQIKQRLTDALDRLRGDGRITDACYRQARGDAPEPVQQLDGGRDGGHAAHDHRSGVQGQDRQGAILDAARAFASSRGMSASSEAEFISQVQQRLDTNEMRLVVSNGSKRIERRDGAEWIATKVEGAGNLKSGVYKLSESRAAVTNNSTIQYSGTVLHVDERNVYQQLGRDNIARHDRKAFDQAVDIGANVTVRYEAGRAKLVERGHEAKTIDRSR